jgi:hypothetical protein
MDLEISTSKYFNIEKAPIDLRTNKQKIASDIDLCLEEIKIIEKNIDAYVSTYDSFMTFANTSDDRKDMVRIDELNFVICGSLI